MQFIDRKDEPKEKVKEDFASQNKEDKSSPRRRGSDFALQNKED